MTLKLSRVAPEREPAHLEADARRLFEESYEAFLADSAWPLRATYPAISLARMADGDRKCLEERATRLIERWGLVRYARALADRSTPTL